MSKDIHIIGQGTYGCVYKPYFDCVTKKPNENSKDFLSKIQVSNQTTENEIKIGKLVKSLDKTNNRFAPIEEDCKITIGEINESGIEKCKLITQYENYEKKNPKKNTNFKSTKIKFVGKENLSEYLESGLIKMVKPSKEKENEYLKKVVNTYLYLLESLILLEKKSILHMDIKYNNIMYNGRSVILIDFGISYDAENLKLEKYVKEKTPFGIKAPFYIPWCIEIIILSHISHDKLNKKPEDMEKVLNTPLKDISYLKTIIETYQKKNMILNSENMFSNEDRKLFDENLKKWVESLEGKTWREIWVLLTNTYKSWDNYSVAVMYLLEMQISGLLDISKKNESKIYINTYIDNLKQTIVAIPGTRQNPDATLSKCKSLFGRIPKQDHKKVVKTMKNLLSDKKNIKSMTEERASINAETLEDEVKLNRKQQKMS